MKLDMIYFTAMSIYFLCCRIYYNHSMTDKGKIALRTAVIERDPNLCELKFAV